MKTNLYRSRYESATLISQKNFKIYVLCTNVNIISCQIYSIYKTCKYRKIVLIYVPVDMIPGRPVVQSIETKVELFEELDPVLRLHDRVMVGLYTSKTKNQD